MLRACAEVPKMIMNVGVAGMPAEDESVCQGVDCPGSGPIKVPITLTYVLYDQGELGVMTAS